MTMNCRNQNEGYILPTTLVALTIMLAVILSLAALSQAELKSSRYAVDLVRAKYAAVSVMELAKAELSSIDDQYFHYRMVDPAWVERIDQAGSLGIEIMTDSLDLGKAHVEAEVEDECGKLDLNYLTRRQMADLTGFGLEAADPVIDWRDPDSQPQEFGAESDDYLQQGMDYPAKNEPFETLDELILVKGYSKAILETELGGGRLRDFITVWSLGPQLAPDGKSKLNLNTATAAQLQSRCPGLTKEDAQRLADFSKSRGFESLGQLFDISGLTRKKIAAVVDYLTVGSETGGRGEVNINTAPFAVIKALVGEETAVAVWQARSKAVFYRTLGELVEDESLSTEALAKLVTYCSVGSYRFRAVITAAYGRAKVKLFAIIDRSTGAPKVIYTAFQNP
jgi:general secretion pathway protein K